jgi:DNA replication and repair protein RecF
MRLSHVHLEQFRCYQRLDIELPAVGMRLAGSNASGKTSFLESIQLLSTLRSARAGVDRELINWSSNEDYGLPPYARVSGSWNSDGDNGLIEVALTVDAQRPTHTRKQVKVDGHPRRAIDAVGLLKTVLFEPEDMELVLGSPSIRRRYLDVAISTLDATYLRLLSQYNKIVEQRNSLLKSLRENGAGSRHARLPELEYWDQEMINRAAFLVAARLTFLNRMLAPLAAEFFALSGNHAKLSIAYGSAAEFPQGFETRVDAGDMVDAQRRVLQWLEKSLEERRDEEFRRGVSVFGPHRDDLQFVIDGRELSAFGSRGQQRLAVVSLKLAQVEVVRDATGEIPVLLLDDVLSELDRERRERLLNRISELGGQVVVTATDARFLDTPQLEQLPLFHVQDGELHADRDSAS